MIIYGISGQPFEGSGITIFHLYRPYHTRPGGASSSRRKPGKAWECRGQSPLPGDRGQSPGEAAGSGKQGSEIKQGLCGHSLRLSIGGGYARTGPGIAEAAITDKPGGGDGVGPMGPQRPSLGGRYGPTGPVGADAALPDQLQPEGAVGGWARLAAIPERPGGGPPFLLQDQTGSGAGLRRAGAAGVGCCTRKLLWVIG